MASVKNNFFKYSCLCIPKVGKIFNSNFFLESKSCALLWVAITNLHDKASLAVFRIFCRLNLPGKPSVRLIFLTFPCIIAVNNQYLTRICFPDSSHRSPRWALPPNHPQCIGGNLQLRWYSIVLVIKQKWIILWN